MNVKTWTNGEYFLVDDYDRIADNIREICNKFSYEVPVFPELNFYYIVYVEDMNILSDFVNTVARKLWGKDLPNGFENIRRFVNGSVMWDSDELNALENDLQIIFNEGSAFDELKIRVDSHGNVRTANGNERIV